VRTDTLSDWKCLAALADDYKTSNWIFRGVEDEAYELIPRIGRPDASKDLNSGGDLGYSADFETRCIVRFKREARPHMIIEPRSDLDWLSIAQQHGLPTRLLDWTESPLVAAYFALRAGGSVNKQPKNAAIYGLPCPQIVSTDEELSASSADVVAYFPQHLTPRITAQRGLFTHHRVPDSAYKPSDIVKWLIPSGMCFTLKVILNKCGFNEASMFPDLVGVANHVGWLLKWRLL
jgi:hypothetical protein